MAVNYAYTVVQIVGLYNIKKQSISFIVRMQVVQLILKIFFIIGQTVLLGDTVEYCQVFG